MSEEVYFHARRALEAAERAAQLAADEARVAGDDVHRRAWADAEHAIHELRLGLTPRAVAAREAAVDGALEHLVSRLPDGYRARRDPQTGALTVEVDAGPAGGIATSDT